MSFLDLATISFHRRNEVESRINTFVGKCDIATNNIQKLKERAKGFVDHLNCEQSELKDRFLNCMQRLEEYTYLITDFNMACEQFEATIGTETEPVHDNVNSPAPPVSPKPNTNLIDMLSETVHTTMTVCTAQCPTKVFNYVKVPKDQQKLIQFSSTSCSSESVPEVKVEKTVECNKNAVPVATSETASGDLTAVSNEATTGGIVFAMNETTNDDVTGTATTNDDITLSASETLATETLEKTKKIASNADYTSSEENNQGRGRCRKRPNILTDSETSDGDDIDPNGDKNPLAAKIQKILNTNVTETSRNKALYMQLREKYIHGIQPSKSSHESKSNSGEDEERPEDLHSNKSYSRTVNKEKVDGRSVGISRDDEDYNRRLKSLEEKSNTASNLLGTLLVGMKEIKQLLARNNNDNSCNKTNNKDAKRIKAALPLETKEAIGDFEKLLSEEKYHREFIQLLQQIGGFNGKDFTERIFLRIFSPLFAKNNTWDGKLSKYPVRDLTLINIIQETILTKFPSWSSAEFEKTAGNWFRLGSQRAGQQPCQQKKRSANNSQDGN